MKATKVNKPAAEALSKYLQHLHTNND